MEDFLLLDRQLSADELAWRDRVRAFVSSSVSNKMGEAFEQGIFPTEFIKSFAQLKLFGMTLPKEFGGAGASHIAYGLVCQELEYGDSSLRSFLSVQNSLCIYPLFMFGSDAQKQAWLSKMLSGEVICCFALSEDVAGSDPSSILTTATKVADGWELNGSKKWITNAPIADVAIIWAKIEDGSIQAFLVPKDTPGFKTKAIKHKMSLRSSITGEITLEACRIPSAQHLPGTAKGILAALECLTQARYGIAWGAIGAAMSCYDVALDYCIKRKQFAKPIASFQLVQKSLVDMFVEINKAQCLNLQIGRLIESADINYVMISVAKMNACHEALQIARSARSLLGANGITLAYPVIRHLQNLEAVSTYEGTDNIHHLIIGRYLTGINAIA